MQVLFCDLHLAVALADIVRSNRRKYQSCVVVHRFCGRFCRATKPRPQKSADFVVRSVLAVSVAAVVAVVRVSVVAVATVG